MLLLSENEGYLLKQYNMIRVRKQVKNLWKKRKNKAFLAEIFQNDFTFFARYGKIKNNDTQKERLKNI